MVKILAFAGSARKDSLNKKVLKIAAAGAEAAGADVTLVANSVTSDPGVILSSSSDEWGILFILKSG